MPLKILPKASIAPLTSLLCNVACKAARASLDDSVVDDEIPVEGVFGTIPSVTVTSNPNVGDSKGDSGTDAGLSLVRLLLLLPNVGR